MKNRISLILAIVLLVCCSVSAQAAAPEGVERQNLDGTEYIVKTYTLPAGSDPAALPEADFEQDGFLFAHQTTTGEEVTATERKTMSEERTAETGSKALEDVLKKFPSTIAYEQDGWSGTLVLDTGSISTEAAGYTTSSRTISTTQTYPAMMYQDPSTIPQTAVKDGVTLPLTGVSWTVTGTSLAGDALVPTEYTATATYSKRLSSQVATGYVSTANYTGEVSRTVVSGVVYTLTYIGTAIPTPIVEPVPWARILAGIAVLLALAGGVAVLLIIRSQQGVAVYNLIEDDYLCIGRQRLDVKRPVIDLNEFEDVIQTNYFSFVLDEASTKKLFGRTIGVTLGDVTTTHRVKETGGKYRFNLEMGVDW